MQENQKSVSEWAKALGFGWSLRERALAVFEEAVELALASHIDHSTLQTALKAVVKKEVERKQLIRLGQGQSSIVEEAADVQLTLYAFAEQQCFQLEHETNIKMRRNRGESNDYFAAKQADKKKRGIR